MTLKKLTSELVDSILSSYTDLKKLNLAHNSLTSIENIERISTLTRLDLSNNEVMDLRPLRVLTALTELNLHSNLICDANILGELPQLKILDLSKNRLYGIDALQNLSQLKSLHTLILAPNPMCSNPAPNIDPRPDSYLQQVFTLLKSLEMLDGSTREECERSLENQELGSGLLWAVTRTQTHTQPAHETDTIAPMAEFGWRSGDDVSVKIQALKEQARAYEKTLEIQERIISQTARHPTQSDDDQTAEHTSLHRLAQTQADGQMEKFPYQELLRAWRVKVWEMLLENDVLRRDTELRVADLQTKVARLQEEALVKSDEGVCWQHKCAAANSQIAVLKKEICDLEQELQEFAERERLAEKTLARRHNTLTSIRRLVEHAYTHTRGAAGPHVIIFEATRRLEEYMQRVTCACVRVNMLGAVLKHKEVQLRNTAAALEAEKRLLHTHSQTHVTDKDSAGDNPCLYPLLFELRPETEAILRDVFCQLDDEDRGCVNITKFCDGVLEDEGVVNVLSKTMGGAWVRLNSLLQRVRSSASQEIGSGLRLELGLESEDMSWGEFLLLLASNPNQNTRTNTVSRRLRNGVSLLGGGLSSEHWAMIPLHFQPVSKSTSGGVGLVSRQGLGNLGPDALLGEASRLARERAFLLQRIQELLRHSERRVEEVWAYFEHDASTMELKLQDQEREVAYAKAEQRKAEARLQEISIVHTSKTTDLEEQIRELQAQLALYMSRPPVPAPPITPTPILTYTHAHTQTQPCAQEEEESLTLTLGMKADKLDSENRILKREASRLGVRVRALERELQQLINEGKFAAEREAQRKSLLEENQQLREELSKLQQAPSPMLADAMQQTDAPETLNGSPRSQRLDDLEPNTCHVDPPHSATENPDSKHNPNPTQPTVLLDRLDRLSKLAERLLKEDSPNPNYNPNPDLNPNPIPNPTYNPNPYLNPRYDLGYLRPQTGAHTHTQSPRR